MTATRTLLAAARRRNSGLTLPTITSGTYRLQLIGDDASAGALASWTSRVGGWSATQGTTAKRPTVVTGGSGIGGRNAVQFDRVDDTLTVPAFNPGGLAAVTIFAVANITTSATDEVIVESSANYNVNNNAFILYKTSANKAFLAAQQGTVNNTFQTTASVVGAAYVFSAINNKAIASNQATVWIDGTAAGTRPFNPAIGGTFNTYDLYIGSRGGTSAFIGMKLAALIICSGALDTTDRTAVETALKQHYGTA